MHTKLTDEQFTAVMLLFGPLLSQQRNILSMRQFQEVLQGILNQEISITHSLRIHSDYTLWHLAQKLIQTAPDQVEK